MNTSEARRSAGLESYLARLDAALSGVPAEDRQEILLETRSHVMERTRRPPSRSVEDVLAELGSPEEYARQFLLEVEPPPAPRPSALRGIARLATGGWTTLPLFVVVIAAYSFAALMFMVAVGKLFWPDDLGLWIWYVDGKRKIVAGSIDTPPPGREVLGYWLVVIPLSISVAIHLLMSALLKRLLRNEARRS